MSNLAVGHYPLGLPFKRIEMWQQSYGVPLPDATQYDLMAHLKQQVKPVFNYLKRLAANSHLWHSDDTNQQILASGHQQGHATALVWPILDDYLYHFSRFVATNYKPACSDDYKEIIEGMKKSLK